MFPLHRTIDGGPYIGPAESWDQEYSFAERTSFTDLERIGVNHWWSLQYEFQKAMPMRYSGIFSLLRRQDFMGLVPVTNYGNTKQATSLQG